MRAISLLIRIFILVSLASQVVRAELILLGDSTVADVTEPLFGWGEVLPNYFEDVEIQNLASSGASSRSYYNRYWTSIGWPFSEPAKNTVDVGDFVLIQFGHNDLPSGPEVSAVQDLDEYKSWLTLLGTEAREAGGRPIFVTPPEGWAYRKSGQIGHLIQRLGHADAMKEVAAELSAPVIDLNAYSIEQFRIRTEEQAIVDFESVDLVTGFPRGDKTHTSFSGAEIWAQFIASEVPAAAAASFASNPGDFNLDGAPDWQDFLILSANFNHEFSVADAFMNGDSNVDGIVDLRDFMIFRSEFRSHAASLAEASVAAVPEPSGVCLCVMGVALFAWRRRRDSLHR